MNALSPCIPEDEALELLLPPDLTPGGVRPLAGGATLHMVGTTMGTNWSLSAVAERAGGEIMVRAALEQAFAQVIAQMSQWEPDSELSRFNRSEANSRHPVSRHFRAVLDCALQVAEASNGAFDPALGRASELWGFGAAPAPQAMPAEAGPATVRAGAGWRDLVPPDGGDLVQPGGLALDFSAIAKGYAVDLGIATLQRMGIEHALLEVGGELKGIGVKPDGQPWWVDIEAPPGVEAPEARIALTGWAIASSGNYRRRNSADGRSWSHSIDPQTFRPLDDRVASVSVLHKDCVRADALSTAITVMGPDSGIAFAERHNLPARVVSVDGTVTSPAWRAWLA